MRAVLIEAFSAVACAGNGAAVVFLDRAASASWMQAVAGSLRQSETAFVLRGWQGWGLRWFTPTCEVRLCGHATLAATMALGHWRKLAPGRSVRFESRSGPLEGLLVQPPSVSGSGTASISLPAGTLHREPAPSSLAALLLASELSCSIEAFWRSALGYAVVEVPQSASLAGLGPIGPELPAPWRDGVVIMQRVTEETPGARRQNGMCPDDYQLRFFAPGLGIDEDPVTGSAHALVAPLWMERLGTTRVNGWQCSDRPGGMVCEATDSGMIRLSGSGHLLWDGSLVAPAWSSACEESAQTPCWWQADVPED